MKYKLVACGGTFDLLHQGHKDFLKFAVSQADKLIIGLTTDDYVQKYKPRAVQSFEIRKHAIENFLGSATRGNFEIVPLSDRYGPAVDPSHVFDAIVVTRDTFQGAEAINRKRRDKGLLPLEIIVFEMKIGEHNETISSTHIREGRIDRTGNPLIKPEWYSEIFILPENLRQELKKPFGELIQNFEEWINDQELDEEKIITVGDATTKRFHENKINPQLSIVDFKVKRRNLFHNLKELGINNEEEIIHVKNQAGEIHGTLIEVLRDWFDAPQNKAVVVIEGEDDLAVLPILLAAPLGFVIFYGQPDEGMVKVVITEEKKQQALELFEKFETK